MFFQHADVIGLLLQTTGIIIISIGQVRFLYRVKKKDGLLIEAFLEFTKVRVTSDEKKRKKASKAELEEYLKKFPLAKFLYDDFMVSLGGLVCTLIGVVISLLGALQHYLTV